MTNQYYFLGTRTTFIRAVPKIFCSVTGTLLSSLYNHHLLFCLSLFCTPGLCLKQRHITVSSYKLTNWLQYILVPRASVSFGHVLGTNRIIILVPSATREWVFIFFRIWRELPELPWIKTWTMSPQLLRLSEKTMEQVLNDELYLCWDRWHFNYSLFLAIFL